MLVLARLVTSLSLSDSLQASCMKPSGKSSVIGVVLKLLTSKEMYSFCPKSGPPSIEIVLPIADLYPLIVEGTNRLISKR
jgi:hypothetical protein